MTWLDFTKNNTAPWGLDGFNFFCIIRQTATHTPEELQKAKIFCTGHKNDHLFPMMVLRLELSLLTYFMWAALCASPHLIFFSVLSSVVALFRELSNSEFVKVGTILFPLF